MQITIKSYITYCTLVMMTLPGILARQLEPDASRVLLLNSYHQGYLWTDEITRGVQEIFDTVAIDLHIEYMDSKRQYDSTYLAFLTDILTYKHQKHHYDLVISSDNNALHYLRHNPHVFDTIPIVFCGINNYKKEDLGPLKNITGVIEQIDIESNLQLITSLHPMCSKIVLITDNTPTGQRIQEEIRAYQNKHDSSHVPIELIYDVSINELTHLLHRLDPKSIVLFSLFFRDNKGEYLEYDKAATLISENSIVPVYGVWKFYLDSGIMGGYLAEGYLQGSMAAQSALKILDGTPANELPIIKDLPSQLYFDFNQLDRHGIAISDLPDNCIILNEPDRYNQLIKKGLWIFGTMSVLIVVLLLIISYMRRMKRQLSRSQSQLTSFISNLPGVVYRCLPDSHYNFVFVSDSIINLCGLSATLLQGEQPMRYLDIVHPDDQEFLKTKLYDAIKQQKAWSIDYRIIHTNGEFRWVNECGQVIANQNHEVEFMDGLILDITARKKAEDIIKSTNNDLKTTTYALQRSNAELTIALEEAKRSKALKAALKKLKETQSQLVQSEKMAMLGTLSAGIAHEVNNPLNYIHGSRLAIVDYIHENLLPDQIADLDPLLDNIEIGLSRSTKIISSLSYFSHVSEDITEKCDVHAILDNCLVMLNIQLRQNIKVSKSYTHMSFELIGNKGQLHQVFLNILMNAVQAIPDKGTISIATSLKQTNLIININDTGIGISPDHLLKVTDPFFTTKPPGEGTGLGLAISNKIIKDHSGQITFESELNKGTTVIIALPIQNNG